MVDNSCLEDELETINDTFFAIDIGETDGRISFDELLDVALDFDQDKLGASHTRTPSDPRKQTPTPTPTPSSPRQP